MTTQAVTKATPIQLAIATMDTPAFKEQLKALLPTHVKVDQFLSVARRGLNGNKALNWTTMDRNTLFSSCLKAAEQGLKLDGEEAALVQYGANVQFMKMIKGVKKQLRNSGEIKEITAEVVYKNDRFSYWVDDEGKHIKHEPNFLEDRGEPICAYSVITTKDGGRFIKVMSKSEIDAVKGASKTGNANFSPWNGPFMTEMWCKTVLRRNAKDAPSSTDLSEVFKEWDEDFDFDRTRPTGQTVSAETSSSESQTDKPANKKTAKRKSRLDEIVESESEEAAQVPADLMAESPQVESSELPI